MLMIANVERGLVCVLLTAAACGGSSSKQPDAMPQDAGPDAGMAVEKAGSVLLAEQLVSGTMTTVSVAGFTTRAVALDIRTDGPCLILRRTQGPATADSAGTITVTGSSSSFDLVPDGQGQYAGHVVQAYQFTNGEQISVSAAGATVPAFTETLTFPADVTVTSPATLSTLSMSGFSAAWNATTSPVHITITQSPDSAHSIEIDCVYPGSDGTGSVPATSLTDLVAGAGPTDLSVVSELDATTSAGDYTLTLITAFSGLSASVAVQP